MDNHTVYRHQRLSAYAGHDLVKLVVFVRPLAAFTGIGGVLHAPVRLAVIAASPPGKPTRRIYNGTIAAHRERVFLAGQALIL